MDISQRVATRLGKKDGHNDQTIFRHGSFSALINPIQYPHFAHGALSPMALNHTMESDVVRGVSMARLEARATQILLPQPASKWSLHTFTQPAVANSPTTYRE